MNCTFYDLMLSWLTKKGIYSTNSLLDWINEQNKSLKVSIKRISLDESDSWFYDKQTGIIKNKNDGFFSISGIQQYLDGVFIAEQPIIIQNEIGFLGIICTKINGILHFLMQAKIEPGNINKVQISPTIQATKSNFMQKHGGKRPAFLEYFIEAKSSEKLVDQIQSEQSSRFLKKRNRNVIIYTNEFIPEPSTHRWMTLGQIKELMHYDNLVNMDTRSVISCIPFSLLDINTGELNEIGNKCKDEALLKSIVNDINQAIITEIYDKLNNYKMFKTLETRLVDLYNLRNWKMEKGSYTCMDDFPFRLIFCDISIDGREVFHWTQPLFEAQGIATFGLICCEDHGIRKFLVRAKPEIGCFDGIEVGPTIQREATQREDEDAVTKVFFNKLSAKDGVVIDVLLSEEGGRFYHEQNRNIIINIQKDELPSNLLEGYFWCDYKTLNILVQVNNCLNIQLRNLLALLEV